MTKFEIAEKMEELKAEMFRSDVNYDIICEYSRVIGLVEQEAMKDNYVPFRFEDLLIPAGK